LLVSGGVPGVLFGVWALDTLNVRDHERGLFLVLGLMILTVSLGSLYKTLRSRLVVATNEHARWLPPLAVIIGSEVGFSSAGAGALGALALLNLTKLTPAQVVGTDMVFGLVVSVIGGGLHLTAGHYDSAIMMKLIIGGIAGAYSGAMLSTMLPSRPLRVALSFWLASLGAQLCWKALA
jgi:uncharacterized membrane protein YfcA